MMGYDSLFFHGCDDAQMVARALVEGRVLVTRDTEVMKRRVITSGRLRAILIDSEAPGEQMRQLLAALPLKGHLRPFTLCLECNQPLVARQREEVKDRVPPYVYATQPHYMECPTCRRLYWRGTHWEGMNRKLDDLMSSGA